MNAKQNVGREVWNSRIGFILAAAGMSIGLGNLWRFPYMVGANGGGTFVFAYLVLLFIAAIPLIMIEMAMGKASGKGNFETYTEATGSKALGTGIGGLGLIVALFQNFFYLTIIGYSAYYIYVSAMGLWKGVDPEVLWTTFSNNKIAMLAVFAVICVATSVIVYRGIANGIEKVCKILLPLVFVFFIILAIRTLTLPNALAGIEYYMKPDWSQLGKSDLWVAAAAQVLFSVGIGPGYFIVYGSHLKKKNDIALNSITIGILDAAVAVLAGFAIIPAAIALGFAPDQGVRLMFVIVPALFKLIPGGQILGILLFTSVLFAGLSTSVANLEVPTTSIMDRFGWSRAKTVGILTVVTVIGAIPCIYNEAFLSLMSDLIGYGFTLTTGIMVVTFAWVYGTKKIRENHINPTSDIKMPATYDFIVKFISAPILLYIVVRTFI